MLDILLPTVDTLCHFARPQQGEMIYERAQFPFKATVTLFGPVQDLQTNTHVVRI